MIGLFYQNYLDKLITTFFLVDIALLIAKSTIKSIKLTYFRIKYKHSHLAKIKTNKQVKKNEFDNFYLIFWQFLRILLITEICFDWLLNLTFSHYFIGYV